MEDRGASAAIEAKNNPMNSLETEILKRTIKKNVAFLSFTSDDARAELLSKFKKRKVSAGKFLYNQGESGKELYIITEGEAEVLVRGKGLVGRQYIVDVIGAGDSIGELALLYNDKRLTSIKALTELEVWVMKSKDYVSVLNKYGNIGEGAAALSAERRRQHLKNLDQAINKSSFFQHIDDEQKRIQLLHAFKPVIYKKGDTIIRQGRHAEYFYVLVEGKCDITVHSSVTSKPLRKAVITPGNTFGEVALLYDTTRGASVNVTSEEAVCYKVDRNTFQSMAREGSMFLKQNFETHATEMVNDEQLMSKKDFLRMMSEELEEKRGKHDVSSDDQHSDDRTRRRMRENLLHMMWRLARADDEQQYITFTEFCLFHMLLERENPEYEIAFRLFDTNRNGVISKEEFQNLMTAVMGPRVNTFDFSAPWLVNYFGKKGDKEINYDMFKSLLHDPNLQTHMEHFLDNLRLGANEVMSHINAPSGIDIGESFTIVEGEGAGKKNAKNVMIAGAIAGAVSRTCTAPLDRLKILLQLQTNPKLNKFNGLIGGFRFMYQESGLLGFFRGNGANVLKIAPETAMKFLLYDRLKHALFEDDIDNLSSTQRFVAGATAGAITQAAIYPMETIKTRLAGSAAGTYRGLYHCGSSILKQQGAAGMYRGVFASLAGIIPYAGTDLAVFDTLKTFYYQSMGEEPEALALLACGTASSIAGQTVSYPFLLMRTRLQMQGVDGRKERSMVDLFRRTLQYEGFSGLYRGIVPNYLKAVPAVSISYMVYELTRRKLDIHVPGN